MNTLIIVESPTKAKTLGRFLGKEYTFEATKGHIKDLPKSPISVDIEHEFKPDYQFVDRQKDTIRILKKAAKTADMVYLATDPDREGEAIAAHVKELLKGSKIKRIVFHEITREAVEHAIADPHDVDDCLVDAQVARRVLDRLVGYKLSPLLWKKVRRGLSAGRVQSVAVRLIVERECEIDAFNPQEYWEIGADVKKDKDEFFISLVKIDGKKAEVKNGDAAKKIVEELKSANYKVSSITKKEVKKNPYAPFTTSTMTQAGAAMFGWSAKRTMMVAQKLYEEGLITYHRTDSTNLSKTALDMARNYIKSEFGDEYLPEKARVYKKKQKSAQEAHEAIRVTDVGIVGSNEKVSKVGADNKRLYDLIWARYLSSQMTPAVYDRTTINVETGKYLLRVSGQTTKFDGWTLLRQGSAGQSSDKNGEVELPQVSEGDSLELVKVKSEQKFTKHPARFNEASLIKTLESLGIGRPSTYAPTISTIQLRNYVEKKDKAFHPTSIGKAVVEFLTSNFPDTFEYEFTAAMEGNLDKVARGELTWQDDMKKFWDPLAIKIKDVEENAERVAIETEKLNLPCPRCELDEDDGEKGELIIRTGRFGKFISCSAFPDCEYTDKYVIKIDMKCPQCQEDGKGLDDQGEVVVKKTKKGRTFYGCSTYPDCEYASWKKPVDPNKPNSEDEELVD